MDWRKGRVTLKSGEKYEMKQEGHLIKLVVNDVEESDAGKYTCKTKDSQSSAELTVRGKQEMRSKQSHPHLVHLGVILSCNLFLPFMRSVLTQHNKN